MYLKVNFRDRERGKGIFIYDIFDVDKLEEQIQDEVARKKDLVGTGHILHSVSD